MNGGINVKVQFELNTTGRSPLRVITFDFGKILKNTQNPNWGYEDDQRLNKAVNMKNLHEMAKDLLATEYSHWSDFYSNPKGKNFAYKCEDILIAFHVKSYNVWLNDNIKCQLVIDGILDAE